MYQGSGGIATPLVPLSQVSQGTVLIQNAPIDRITVEPNVYTTNGESDDFFTLIIQLGHHITKINVEVEIFRNRSRSGKFHECFR